jgi:hypothetical protein
MPVWCMASTHNVFLERAVGSITNILMYIARVCPGAQSVCGTQRIIRLVQRF